jgi:hypothetical protein
MATKSTKDTKAFFVIYVPFVANSLLVVGRWLLGVWPASVSQERSFPLFSFLIS